ncbi:MAG: trypsin-like peptidase domain-containing protein [Bryobacteraceae bacterium]|nr:trypsin-like peptidase domain-containing protein [Bryobacteraceae bacterium]
MNFGEVGEMLRRGTVAISGHGRAGQGSGIVWEAGGLIVTNAHVVAGAANTVTMWDGRKFAARVLTRDARRDLALLEVNASALPMIPRGRDGSPRAGELVIAVGNPLGFAGALSTGVVHAVGPVPGLGPREWVQADVRLAPGNSGGPLADAEGRLAGINTMVIAPGRRALGLSIPAAAVEQFLRHGPDQRSLGVTVRAVRGGLLLLEVEPGRPADRASLLAGDLILSAAAARMRTPGDLSVALDQAAGTLEIEFLRGGASPRRVTVAFPPARASAA